MAFSLASISKTKNAKPPRIVIHGEEKIGKSSFFAGVPELGLAGAPNPIFIRTEDGLNGVDANAFPLCQSFNDAKEQLNVVLNEQHDFKTLVIDSADWLEKLIHLHVCELDGKTSIEEVKGGFGKGPLIANNHWREVLTLLDQINTRRLMWIGVICHSRIVNFSDPEHEPYDTYRLKLHSPKSGNGSCEMLVEWADIVAFAQKEKFVRAKETTQGIGKSEKTLYKGVTTNNRFLHLEGTAAFQAGHRYKLPAKMKLSWPEFETAFFTGSQPVTHLAVNN